MITRTQYTQMHAHILMQISFMDEYEGLSEDEALLTSTRRIVNLWCLVFLFRTLHMCNLFKLCFTLTEYVLVQKTPREDIP